MYNDYRDLILKHKGKRIAIMGGGATLDDDITAIKADVVISTNAHGVDHPHDYVIAMDDNHGQGGDMVPFIRARTDAPIIGPQKGADYHLFGWPNYPRRLYTGNVAIWMAWQMGAKSVVLAGVDGYNASPNYLRQVQQVMSVVTCPVRCVGGRLFDKYNPDESFGRYKPDPRITAETASEDDTITVEIVKGTAIEGKRHFSGQTWTGKKITVHRLLRAGVVRAV